jgi:hypothetical protein
MHLLSSFSFFIAEKRIISLVPAECGALDPTMTNDRTKQKAMEAITDIYGKQLMVSN